MAEDAPFLPGLSPVSGKSVHVALDGGRLTSDAGVLVLAGIERKLQTPRGWPAASPIRERPSGCGTALPR
jgi:hypothetical protein